MKLVNAGLSSCTEAYNRLKNGDVFYDKKTLSRIHYAASYLATGDTPFRLDSQPLMSVWSDIVSWREEKPEPEWKPCLCWVSNFELGKAKSADAVVITERMKATAVSDQGFKSRNGLIWKYATPMTREEVEKYINE